MATAGVGCALEAPEDAELDALGGAGPVTSETVCFTVHNPGDPNPLSVTGTLQYGASYDQDTRFLLLVHGGASNRAVWNGGVRGRPLLSFSRQMVEKGYAVIAIDRPGHGDSRYHHPASGYMLSAFSQVEMLNQVISQLKTGAYQRTSGSCASGGSSGVAAQSVVLVGHSVGAAISTQYAARYDGVDGLVSLGWQNQGLTSTAGMLIGQNVRPACESGQGYAGPFAPGASGVSDQCRLGRWYEPNANPDDVLADCANENLGVSPCAEFGSVPSLQQANRDMVSMVGPLPVLLAFMQFDNMVGAPGYHGPNGIDPDHASTEIQMWQAGCPTCSLSTLIQSQANHAGMLHNNVDRLVKDLSDWLSREGLSARLH